MNCGFDKEKLDAFFDGELNAAERRAVEEHISACSECLRDLGEIRAAAQQVHGLARLRAPASLAESVSRAVAAEARSSAGRRFGTGLFWVTAAAAAVLVVMNVAYFTDLKKETPAEVAVVTSTDKVKQEEGERVAKAAPEPADHLEFDLDRQEAGAAGETLAKDAPASKLSGKRGEVGEEYARVPAAVQPPAAAPASPLAGGQLDDREEDLVAGRVRSARGKGDPEVVAEQGRAAINLRDGKDMLSAAKTDAPSDPAKKKMEYRRAELESPEEKKVPLPEVVVFVPDVARARVQVEEFLARKGGKPAAEQDEAVQDGRVKYDLYDDELAELCNELTPMNADDAIWRTAMKQTAQQQTRRRIVLVLQEIPAAEASRAPAAK